MSAKKWYLEISHRRETASVHCNHFRCSFIGGAMMTLQAAARHCDCAAPLPDAGKRPDDAGIAGARMAALLLSYGRR
ncbi:hypothetical protein [Bradyrhizobium sp. CER78]|uniref:hypothetical protein n=1 Tax=Bradyrhizobium sp. CER78 TaxID=3039162 RepID=UPI00244CF0AD|nr:hypothetical protein [Bradyrhizobium sp. CER78]MDH2379936.1 hypothetical protein [Bradyrhizobium sp. CER78]